MKTFYKIIFLIALSIGVISCNNRSIKSSDKVSLRLQWFHLAQFSGFYCGQDQGFYKRNKIDLTINPGGPDFNAITLVANGDETFGVWTADQILMAQNRGVPITIIAAIFRDDPNVLMVKQESKIFTPSDFKGKTITTVYGRSTETVLKALLRKENIKESEVNIVPFPFNLQSFLNGNVDISAAYIYDHPYQAENNGLKIRIINPKDYGIKFYSDCIFVRNELIKDNPGLVQRFISATLDGWRYAILENDSAVVSTIRRSPQLTKESQYFMLKAAKPLILAEDSTRIGIINENSLLNMTRILQDQNLLPKYFDSNKSFTNQFVNKYYELKGI